MVALAAYKLSSKILTNASYVAIAVLSASFAINYSQPWLFPVLVICGGFLTILNYYLEKLLGLVADGNDPIRDCYILGFYNWKIGVSILFLWMIFLIIAIMVRSLPDTPIALDIFSTLYFVGSIIFG